MKHPDLGPVILRDEYQFPAHIDTVEYCKNYEAPGVIDMSVGAGKTIMIGALAKHVTDKGGKVLVLARTAELIEQNSSDAWLMGCKNSIFSSGLGQKSISMPCVMGTEGTVVNYLNTHFTKSNNTFVPALLLIDECHHADWQEVQAYIDDNEPPQTQYAKIIVHLMHQNPKLRIIGYTGSPYRGVTDIIGPFWKEKITEVSTMQLIELGYLVPPVFGFGDDSHAYDLSEFKPKGGKGQDYTRDELNQMEKKIRSDLTMTQRIMEEVIERCKDRNGVLITCAGKKHCEQVAECLPDGSWGIVTDSTPTKQRRDILAKAKTGEIKYVIQVGCLTTGINVPLWDVCVILRRIGSLTLLTQLVGRVLRTLKKEHISAGFNKDDALILDYTDTFEAMGDIFNDPILDQALAKKAQETGEYQECPVCGTHNSMYAVRCIGKDDNPVDGRCEYFFQFVACESCGTKNAPTAQNCRNCDAIMIDPNSKLINKAYTDADYKPVKTMTFNPTKNHDGLWVIYELDSVYHKNGIAYPEIAKELYKPFDKQPHQKARWRKFINDHINCNRFRRGVAGMRTVSEIIKNKAIFDVPVKITHRVNDKGFSIVNRKEFRSGREVNE